MKFSIYLLVISNFSKLFYIMYMYTARILPLIYTHQFFTTDFVTHQLDPSMFYNIFCNSFITCQLHLNVLQHIFTTDPLGQFFSLLPHFAPLLSTSAPFLYSLELINQSIQSFVSEQLLQQFSQHSTPCMF